MSADHTAAGEIPVAGKRRRPPDIESIVSIDPGR
jgi:hypothetical protein